MSETNPWPRPSATSAADGVCDDSGDFSRRPGEALPPLPMKTIAARSRIDRAIVAHALYHAGLLAAEYSRADAGERWHEFALDTLGLQIQYGDVADHPRLSSAYPALAVVHRCQLPSQLLSLATAVLRGQPIGSVSKQIDVRCRQLLTRAIELESAATADAPSAGPRRSPTGPRSRH